MIVRLHNWAQKLFPCHITMAFGSETDARMLPLWVLVNYSQYTTSLVTHTAFPCPEVQTLSPVTQYDCICLSALVAPQTCVSNYGLTVNTQLLEWVCPTKLLTHVPDTSVCRPLFHYNNVYYWISFSTYFVASQNNADSPIKPNSVDNNHWKTSDIDKGL